jgi:hypothetical protein
MNQDDKERRRNLTKKTSLPRRFFFVKFLLLSLSSSASSSSLVIVLSHIDEEYTIRKSLEKQSRYSAQRAEGLRIKNLRFARVEGRNEREDNGSKAKAIGARVEVDCRCTALSKYKLVSLYDSKQYILYASVYDGKHRKYICTCC